MRTLVTILAFSFALFTYAQETVTLEDVYLTANADYLSAVQDNNTPDAVKLLQTKVATYDVRSNSEFDQNAGGPFEMVFKNSRGKIDAFYNSSGAVVATLEKFMNIRLPYDIRNQVFKANSDWTMVENQYTSAYSDNNLIKRSYKIKLRKGDHNKDVVINLK